MKISPTRGLNTPDHRPGGASARHRRRCGIPLPLLLWCLLTDATAADVFLSSELTLPPEPPRFWAGEPASLNVYSHRLLSNPKIYVLSDLLAAPVEIKFVADHSLQTPSGLFLHAFSITAPETRLPQRYTLRYPEADLGLNFEVYPQWLRQQVAAKAALFSIRLQNPTSQATDFIALFQSKIPDEDRRPELEIVSSEDDLLVRITRNRFIWKTNFNRLDAKDPRNTVRFETVLDTLNDLSQQP